MKRTLFTRALLALALTGAAMLAAADDTPAAAPTPTPARRVQAPLRERLLFPLGATRQAAAAAQPVPLLRFHEEIEVEAPPLDLQRLRALWWKHWNLTGKPGTGFGTPTHSDMLQRSEELSRLSGMPLPPNASLLPLAVAAGQALVKKIKPERMPPADPGPPYVEPFVPLEPPPESTPAPQSGEVLPGPSPGAAPTPSPEPAASNESANASK